MEQRQFAQQRTYRDMYEEQICELKYLKSSGASIETLKAAAINLKQIKAKLKKDSLQLLKIQDKEYYENVWKSWDSYPSILSIPHDSDGYVLGFLYDRCSTNMDDVFQFFHKYGFVVFENVLNEQDCATTCAEIWDQLEEKNAGLDRNNFETFELMSSKTYGLAPQPAVFSDQLLKNRINPKVIAIFQAMLQSQDIIISHDRWCLYRPTQIIKDKPEYKNSWKTPSNLHLDLNPWTYNTGCTPINDLEFEHVRDFSKELNGVSILTSPNIQGILSLTDNHESDGGTLLVPGFHHIFAKWCSTLSSMKDQIARGSRQEENRLVWRGHGAGSYKFSSFDPIHSLKQRITMRAGSLLIWDQRVVHGSSPNHSHKFRIAQFIRAFRESSLSSSRFQARSAYLKKEFLRKERIKNISDSGKKVLGIK